MTIEERVATALGWTRQIDNGGWCWVSPSGIVYREHPTIAPSFLPDPADWNVVMQLRDLAIEKDSHGYTDALFKEASAAKYAEGHGRERRFATATKEQVRDAALAVIEGQVKE